MRARPQRLPSGNGAVRAAVAHADHAGRAFTLIEVMVALSAGVLVSMAAFMLSKNATAYFQREARVASAQLALTLGMNRLTGDIQRAALLSTANFMADPNVCRQSPVPTGLKNLSGVAISVGTQTVQGKNQSKPLSIPDQIIIGGSMDSSEVYQVQSIVGAGAATVLMRGPNSDPATYRAVAGLGADTLLNKMVPIFYPSIYPVPAGPPPSSGRFAHIYHPATNTHVFAIIDSMTIDTTTGAIKVLLLSTPAPLPVQGVTPCGVMLGDAGGGWLFSVVSRVQYAVKSMAGTTLQYQQLVTPPSAAQAQATGDADRTELVRTELDYNDVPIDATAQVVAEYAVDLRFGITVSSQVVADNYNPTTLSYGFGDTVVTDTTGSTTTGHPQWVRAVQVRLSTRTRAPDRDTDLPQGPDGRRLRFLVDATLQPAYARVRTNYANVALPNQGGFSLW